MDNTAAVAWCRKLWHGITWRCSKCSGDMKHNELMLMHFCRQSLLLAKPCLVCFQELVKTFYFYFMTKCIMWLAWCMRTYRSLKWNSKVPGGRFIKKTTHLVLCELLAVLWCYVRNQIVFRPWSVEVACPEAQIFYLAGTGREVAGATSRPHKEFLCFRP